MHKERKRPQVRNKDGSINQDVLFNRYGLRVSDVTDEQGRERRVKFTSKNGKVHEDSVIAMLSDRRCPVGGLVEKAYQDRGIDGVIQVIGGMKAAFGQDLDLSVSEETVAIHKERERRTKAAESSMSEGAPSPTQAASEAPATEVKQQEVQPSQVQVSIPLRDQSILPNVETARKEIAEPVQLSQNVTPDRVQQETPPKAIAEVLLHVPPKQQEVKRQEIILPRVLPIPLVQRVAPEITPVPPTKLVIPHIAPKETLPQKFLAEPISQKPQQVDVTADKQSLVDRVTGGGHGKEEKDVHLRELRTVIDTLILSDIPVAREKTTAVLGVQKKGNEITLGMQEQGESTPEPVLKPIRTIDALTNVLPLLEQITSEFAQSSTKTTSEHFDLSNKLLLRRDRPAQEKTPSLNLFVSDEILHYLEQGKEIFEEMQKAGKVSEADFPQLSEQKQMVRVFSGTKELSIDITTLTKLIELVSVRKQMFERVHQAAWAIPEEAGLHSLSYRQHDETPFWLAYHNMILSLARADDQQLLDYYQTGSS